jgi:peptidoglycan glycosyltransferase
VNRQIVQMFGLVAVLFAVLVGATSWWTVWGADGLENNPSNRRELLEEQRIPRGLIYARDGTVLARSRQLGAGQTKRYVRTYPQGSLFSHVVGYSFVDKGSAGIERYRNDELAGRTNEFESIIDELSGSKQEGNDLVTSLDPDAQRTALGLLQGAGRGAVVALEPGSGRVRVMASSPDYDPNEIPDTFSSLNRDRSSPLFNRSTQSQYPPGSTFKVVTATAALDSGRYTPGSIVSGKSPKVISGKPLQNAGNAPFGALTLTQGLTSSVNTVWAEVGEKLGRKTMFKYMRRFGLDSRPPIDLSRSELAVSGVFDSRGRLRDSDDPIDIGRVAIGQADLLVSPLQMAEVAATVANRGRRMKPRLVRRVVAKDGRVKERVGSERAATVMKPATAAALTEMMKSVVNSGTGTRAQIPGIQVAGKTGTAEVIGGEANQVWFIGFAPADDPRVALAVTVEKRQEGEQGGTVAAPIAKSVLEELLRR